nr:MAG TPA: hypothetical protein [Caudoviricetes sp.]
MKISRLSRGCGAQNRTTNITFYYFQILWNISYNQIFMYIVNLLKSI